MYYLELRGDHENKSTTNDETPDSLNKGSVVDSNNGQILNFNYSV
jgi:hypothetical protein